MSTNDTIDFNDDELVAPKWLNESFIEKVLQHCEQSVEVDEVRNLNVTPGTAKGDHFGSIMFRVTVEYRLKGDTKTKSMIIKTLPENDCNKKELLEESPAFETEIRMYSEIIPKFESILRSIGDQTKLGASCLYYSLNPRKLIIFEDIVPQGYTVMRDRYPNVEEAKATYAKLAKFHAISYKLNLDYPHIFDGYNYGIFMQPKIYETEMFQDGIKNFIILLETNEDLVKYKPYFTPFLGTIVEECVQLFREARDNPDENALYGLCHGDFHLKNLMFKHAKSGKIEDVMLLDYQMSYFGPIVNDVVYSIYMLLDAKLRFKHLDELLEFYFTTFQETLKRVGFKGVIPTSLNFKRALKKHKTLELYVMMTFLPLWYAFDEKPMDPEEILFQTEKRKTMYQSKKFVDEVRDLLPKYLEKGYLEL